MFLAWNDFIDESDSNYNCKCEPLFAPRCSGRYPWDSEVVRKIELPSRQQILDTIEVKDNPWCLAYEVVYNDGKICVIEKLDEFELKAIGHNYTESIIADAKERVVKKVIDYYNKKKIEEESGMDSTTYAYIANSTKMLNGSFDINLGCYPYKGGDITIKLPCYAAHEIRFDGTEQYKMAYAPILPIVKKVETYNDRVVKVTFADGSFTKSVCSPNDQFDIDVGITICLMKKIMGKDGNRKYNNMIRDIHKTMEKNEAEKAKKQAEKQERKAKQRKVELKKAAEKAKARQEQIDIQATAVLEALRKNKLENGDDLK